MLNTFEETFEVTEMRTFKHEPFFIVGGGGGGLFVVLYGNCFESVGATAGQDERADKIAMLSQQIRQLSEDMEKPRAPRRFEQ